MAQLPGIKINVIDDLTGVTGNADFIKTPLFFLNTPNAYISDITESNVAATGHFIVSGYPYYNLNVIVKITVSGDAGTMGFIYSLDNGTTWSDEVISDSDINTTYELIYPVTNLSTDLYIKLSGTAFVLDDTYSFTVEKGFPKNIPILLSRANYKDYLSGNSLLIMDKYYGYVKDGAQPDYAYVISPPTDISGGVSLYDSTVTGTGTFVVSGTPVDTDYLYIQIDRTAGASGTAEFKYGFDGVTWSDIQLTPTSGNDYYIPTSGITLTFGAGDFVIGDTWVYKMTAPDVTNILSCVATLTPTVEVFPHIKQFNAVSWWCIPDRGFSEAQHIQLKEILNQINQQNHYVYVLTRPYDKGTTDADVWSDTEIAITSFFNDYRQYKFPDYINQGTVSLPDYTDATVICSSILSLSGTSEDPGVGTHSIYNSISRKYEPSMLKLEEKFNNARFSIVHKREDSTGAYKYYFANTQSLGELGTTFKYITDIRPFYKGLSIVTRSLSRFLNSTPVSTAIGLTTIQQAVQSDLNANLIDSGDVNYAEFKITSTIEEFIATGGLQGTFKSDQKEKILYFNIDSQSVNF